MKKFVLIPLAALFAVLAAGLLFASQVGMDSVGIGSLSSSKPGSFPKSWRTWPTRRGRASQVYSVAEENKLRFIKARDDKDISEQIFYQFNWKVEDRPVLSWRWRATDLPEGAAENSDSTNDSACGVYVLIGSRYKGVAIKYVWSSTLPKGTVVSRRGGDLKIKVLESGPGKKGKWVRNSVDVPSDYEALFGHKLDKKLTGIGILTDGNAVHKPAGCDYAAFTLSSSTN
ncbi:MAG TPA: DUF3047 domain-containing protein [bacterium]|nr:DUF3047 domain-containing protein [bacterium]